jgi:hypothetical protein
MTRSVTGRPVLSDTTSRAVVTVVALVLAFFHFGGMPDHYIYVLTAYAYPGIAAADFNLQDSFWPASSVIYWLNQWLHMERRELLVLALAMLIAAGASLIIYRLLRRHFDLSPWIAALATILLMVVDRKILPNAWPVIIPIHPGSPSMITNLLGAAVLLLLAEKRMALAAFTVLGVHLFATKENVLLLPSAVLYALLCRDLGWRKAAWFLLPLAYLAVKSLETRVHAPFETLLELARLNLVNEGGDGNFLVHGPVVNATFLASLLATLWLVRPMQPHVRRLAWAFVATAAALWLVSSLYIAFFWQTVPLPQMFYIGPVRSMRYAVFLFYLVASVRILGDGRLMGHERAGLLIALHGASPHSVTASALAAGVVAAVFLPRLAGQAGRLAAVFGSRPLPETMAVALWVALQVAVTGYYGLRWDGVALAEAGLVSQGDGVPREVWRAYEELREQPPFELLALYRGRSGRVGVSLVLTAHARKPAFAASSFAGFKTAPTLAALAEARRRDDVARSVATTLSAGSPLAPEDVAFLASRGTRIMAPVSDAGAFGATVQSRHGPMVLLTMSPQKGGTP